MTEVEYRRAQEYLLKAWYADMPEPEMAYGLAWLAYLYIGKAPGKMPLPSGFGLDVDLAGDVAAQVESLVEEMRNPHFDRDDPATL